MDINWGESPLWAGAVIEDVFGNRFWIEAYEFNSKRQEFGSLEPDNILADTQSKPNGWVLVGLRP